MNPDLLRGESQKQGNAMGPGLNPPGAFELAAAGGWQCQRK